MAAKGTRNGTTGKKKSGKAGSTSAVKKGTAKKSAGQRVSERRVEREKEELPSDFSNEVTLLVTLVISVLLFLSNFRMSGRFGEIINGVTFGLFGVLAYAVPFLLFFGIAFYLANRKANRRYIVRLLSCIGVFIVLAGMIQLAFGETEEEITLLEYYRLSAEHKNGGGLCGGLLCVLFLPAFGPVGSYVVLVAFLLVFLMLLSGKALFALLADYSERSVRQHREQRRLREERMQQEQEVQENRAQSFLLKQEEPKEEKKTEKKRRNFFGGMTPTSPAGRSEEEHPLEKEDTPLTELQSAAEPRSGMQEVKAAGQEEQPLDPVQEQLVYNGTYHPSADTVKTVNSIYEEEMQKKFGQKESAPEPEFYEGPVSGMGMFSPAAAPLPSRENSRNEGADEIEADFREPPELSFSEQALADRRRAEGAAREKTVFERAPYGLGEPSGPSGASAPEGSTTAASKSGVVRQSAEGAPEDVRPSVPEVREYRLPPMDLLAKPVGKATKNSEAELRATADKLKSTLDSFGVRVTITNVSRGPSVTRYELQPEQGVKVSRITGLADDIKLNLAAADVRIEAPIPGKAAVGIEVPNRENTAVLLRELIESPEFQNHPSDLAFTVGKDIGGQNIVSDIAKMPHLLIAGATGSGKSVCINTIIISILYKAHPSDVKLIMVDPKVVELSVYNGIPHLLIPVVTDPKKASAALNWAVAEMTDRYQKFAEFGVRDLKGYNEKLRETAKELAEAGAEDAKYQKLPQIVIIVDELADLMMVAPGEVEDAICRLAQMARAAGLHLILATQRPSVNVITGLIKANVPSRVAFAVSSSVDSRTILDGGGAEKLLGKGDMLFFPSGYPKPVRIQGAFVSDKEVSAVVDFLKGQNTVGGYNEEVSNRIAAGVSTGEADTTAAAAGGGGANRRDEYFAEAARFIIEKDKASIGMLQRVYQIGFNRAARIMDQLSEAGVVGPEEGTKPRKILMTLEELEQFLNEER